MWKTMQNSDVCAFFEGDLLTVIDREGNVRFADWTDRDRQSVPKELRPSTGELLKHTIRQVLPAGEELWVLTANTWMPVAFAQMQLVRLDRELRGKEYKLTGILNGIDTTSYNPETDPAIFANYGPDDIAPKAVNKAELQKLMDNKK